MTVFPRLLVAALLAISPHLSAQPRDDSAVVEAMRAGGVVILLRHATTESGIGDPPGFTLADCSSQRNLSAAGREEARRFGERLRALGVVVDEVRSSHWCRCVDTARLAFPDIETVRWQPLDSFFGGQGSRDRQTRDALAGLAQWGGDQNQLWVTHQVNISALTGEYMAMGEAVVARPHDGRLEVIGRWRP